MPSLPAIEPPLWAGLIAGYNHADILDAEGLDLTIEQTEDVIRGRNPKEILIVVMGNNPSVSSTPKMKVAEALADRIADLKPKMTGIHPIAAGSKYEVVSKPFEGFPMAPYDKLPMSQYRAHNWHCLDGSPRSPYASVYTSLGCPYDCFYCNIHTLYDGKREVRFRPVIDILNEVQHLHLHYGVKNIKFWDELFALKEARVGAICSGLRGMKLNIWAYARVDTVTPLMLRVMKEAGVNWLAYGFESADMVVREMSGKKFKDNKAELAIKMTRNAGINIIGNFMFGLPGDTDESMQRTLDFAKQHLFEYVNFYQALPYPGSKWFEDLKEKFTLPGYEFDYAEFDQYGENKHAFRDFAFRDYFSNPVYQDMVLKKFGWHGYEEIRKMLAWQVNK